MAEQSGRDGSQEKLTGCYVYGIFPGDIELTTDLAGVGDPAGKVRVVRSGDLAALVSDIKQSGPLGSPEDLQAHKDILDACVSAVPVLPMRFGAVLTDEDAVAHELLDDNHDEFSAALDELDGRAQYVIRGRYDEQAILGEVLAENRDAAQLAQQIKGEDPDATRDARIQLGEIIGNAVEAKRQADTRLLGDRMEGHCAASVVREPSHELDAVNAAFLIEADQEKEMEQAVDDLAKKWHGRVQLRVLGPMAAYDFVVSAQPQG